jgi:HSP20 family protein
MQEQVDLQEVPVKLYRSEDRVTAAAPMPGLEPDNIAVEVTEQKRLVIHGELRGTLKGEKEVLLDEWNPGPYRRDIDLPNEVNGEMANITYNNGVLVVVMPVSDRTTPARLKLTEVSATHGERVGNTGSPVRGSGQS